MRLPVVEEVVLLADTTATASIPKVHATSPGVVMRRALTRAGSKLVLVTSLARRSRFDWILSFNLVPHGINAYVAGRASGTPTMYHMIGGTNEWVGGGWKADNAYTGRLPRPVRPLERGLLAVIKRSTVTCVMGQTSRRRLIAAGVAPDRIQVVPPGINVERFTPSTTPNGPTYDVMTVSGMIPRKRLHDFVALVAAVKERRGRVRAAIVGDGALRDSLQRAAEQAGVRDSIEMLGNREDVEAVMHDSRLFVLTSADEGRSVAMGEAMACGLPAVVTDVGDQGDLVKSGENGYLVAVGAIDEFAERIDALLGDPKLYERCSRAARSLVVATTSVERVSEIYARSLASKSQ